MDMYLIWNYLNHDEISIYRVFAPSSDVSIPSRLCGHPIVKLAPYCFSARRFLPEEFYFSGVNGQQVPKKYHDFDEILPILKQTGCNEICGKALEKIFLPDTVTTLGAYCFYDCRKLMQMTVGSSLITIENDTFMNCHQLSSLFIEGTVKKPSGLKQILNQVSWYLEVSFFHGKEIEVKIIFPEYFETYDEIAPAHLFGRNITGEGFRARQSFQNGVLELTQYDSIFQKACAEETEMVCCQIAYNRILYPVDLKENAKTLYADYIKEHGMAIGKMQIESRDLNGLEFLISSHFFSDEVLKRIVPYAAEKEWPEGSAALLRLQKSYGTPAKPRYSFDENW